MHKGVILLVKATDVDQVAPAVREFMEPHGEGKVWDWYVIGGRWSGTLNPVYNKFIKEVEKRFPPEHKFGYTTDEIKKHTNDFQLLWIKLGGEGTNPFGRSGYDLEGSQDDIVPIAKCLDIVKSWMQDPDKAAKQTLKEGKKSLKRFEKDPKLKRRMQGYYLEKAGQLMSEDFCFDTNVYNIESQSYELPEKEQYDEFYAVMVDMHN